MSVQEIPATAVVFPFYSAVASARLRFIEDAKAVVEQYNRETTSWYKLACENWTERATLDRERLITVLQPKPVAPPSKTQHAVFDVANTLYLWVTLGAPVGPPCPDLPPQSVLPPSGNVSVGKSIAMGWWAALPDDTAPADYEFSVPPALCDVPPGTYRKVSSPFGGWWQKVA